MADLFPPQQEWDRIRRVMFSYFQKPFQSQTISRGIVPMSHQVLIGKVEIFGKKAKAFKLRKLLQYTRRDYFESIYAVRISGCARGRGLQT